MLYVFPQFPLVDVIVDRVCTLIEGALEEQGAHCDGEGEGRSPAEQQGVQTRRQVGGEAKGMRSDLTLSLVLACWQGI